MEKMKKWQYSISELKTVLETNGIRLSKARGQNFLIDKNVLEKLIKFIDLNNVDTIIEVGPGIGGLTNYLMNLGKKLVLIEIDRKLSNIISSEFHSYENVHALNNDFLKVNFEEIIKPNRQNIIVANIPYNLTSKIIEKCFMGSRYFSGMYLLIQKEVAERLVSKEGSKKYGSLSVFVQTFSKPKILFNVSKNVFFPKPKIDSSYVYFSINKNSEKINVKDFGTFLKKIFGLRRKKIENILTKYLFKNTNNNMFVGEILEKCDIFPSSRPEEISQEILLKLWLNCVNLIKFT